MQINKKLHIHQLQGRPPYHVNSYFLTQENYSNVLMKIKIAITLMTLIAFPVLLT